MINFAQKLTQKMQKEATSSKSYRFRMYLSKSKAEDRVRVIAQSKGCREYAETEKCKRYQLIRTDENGC